MSIIRCPHALHLSADCWKPEYFNRQRKDDSDVIGIWFFNGWLKSLTLCFRLSTKQLHCVPGIIPSSLCGLACVVVLKFIMKTTLPLWEQHCYSLQLKNHNKHRLCVEFVTKEWGLSEWIWRGSWDWHFTHPVFESVSSALLFLIMYEQCQWGMATPTG